MTLTTIYYMRSMIEFEVASNVWDIKQKIMMLLGTSTDQKVITVVYENKTRSSTKRQEKKKKKEKIF